MELAGQLEDSLGAHSPLTALNCLLLLEVLLDWLRVS